jgi:Zn finger protein HypA/HybF involved in hydrogenase expression
MGSIIKKKCLSCGKEWDHVDGIGFRSAYYYCDRCGKEKVIDLSDKQDNIGTIGQCDCGGTFRLNSDIIICPFCHSKDTLDAAEGVIALWD